MTLRGWAMSMAVLLIGQTAFASPPAKGADSNKTSSVEVWLHGKAGRVQAWLWRPPGPGPFPALVYNHGSEADPVIGTYGGIGPFFVSHGYVVIFPYRRGAGKSEGRPWEREVDAQPEERQERAMIDRLVVENDDVVTAIEWLRAQPWVARDDISVAGCSFGGIETLLTAERAIPGLRAAVDFAGASMAWNDNPRLRERLLQAVEAARVPIFFLQAQNDFNTAPSTILSEAMRNRKLPSRMRIFPSYGKDPMSGHGGFCLFGSDVWGQDVLDFLRTRH